jgi:hypothetical protein
MKPVPDCTQAKCMELQRLFERVVEEGTERWHVEGGRNESLPEYLGMTPEEYSAYVEQKL